MKHGEWMDWHDAIVRLALARGDPENLANASKELQERIEAGEVDTRARLVIRYPYPVFLGHSFLGEKPVRKTNAPLSAYDWRGAQVTADATLTRHAKGEEPGTWVVALKATGVMVLRRHVEELWPLSAAEPVGLPGKETNEGHIEDRRHGEPTGKFEGTKRKLDIAKEAIRAVMAAHPRGLPVGTMDSEAADWCKNRYPPHARPSYRHLRRARSQLGLTRKPRPKT